MHNHFHSRVHFRRKWKELPYVFFFVLLKKRGWREIEREREKQTKYKNMAKRNKFHRRATTNVGCCLTRLWFVYGMHIALQLHCTALQCRMCKHLRCMNGFILPQHVWGSPLREKSKILGTHSANSQLREIDRKKGVMNAFVYYNLHINSNKWSK